MTGTFGSLKSFYFLLIMVPIGVDVDPLARRELLCMEGYVFVGSVPPIAELARVNNASTAYSVLHPTSNTPKISPVVLVTYWPMRSLSLRK